MQKSIKNHTVFLTVSVGDQKSLITSEDLLLSGPFMVLVLILIHLNYVDNSGQNIGL